ncbi:MAG: type II toxin-antitoxin system HicA family toxin [Prevotellaceae bacterium]|jgi:hypothetical protein|nr:type II toxin-antitoxin system HicA family toxin [Prevotellaceae bacterium]
MSSKDKLIERFKQQPTDFTFDELVRLFGIYGFTIDNKGKTSGSRVRFINHEKGLIIDTHKPHPQNIIKKGALKDIYEKLILFGLLIKTSNNE